MGIRINVTVEDTVKMQFRRRHRLPLLNLVEEAIVKCRETEPMEDDIGLWKAGQDKFKSKFSSKSTWDLLRSQGTNC